jgi:tetratricopeptide (TPR) repeat protein
MIRFAHHNLTRDRMPPTGEAPFDLVTCRNVLIYFERPTVERVARSLTGAARPSGRLILGAADRISGPTASAAGLASAAPPARRRPPRAHAPAPRPAPEDGLAAALAAADAGRLDAAIELIGDVLARDPLNADAHFVRGLAELGSGDASASVRSLRRALYVDPGFSLAAFELGRAQEARGDASAAAQAYEQALRTLEASGARSSRVLDDIDPADIAAVCHLRLRALTRTAS